jgi:putative transposase
VDLALKAFFRRVKAGENPGYPRFRGRGWYDSFTYPQKDGSLVGVDVGLESFATLSNGETIANPRFFREEETELARVQRKLSKAPKGTPERKLFGWLSGSMKGSLTSDAILPIRLVDIWLTGSA